MTRTGVYAALLLLTSSTMSLAADLPLKSPPPLAAPGPTGGFFLGLGGSYNSVKFEQDMFALGLDNTFNGAGVLVASGYALGPGFPFRDTQTTFAPDAQLGYFGTFGTSSWLWGLKLQYKYLGLTSTDRAVVIPQTGASVPPGGGASTPLTGNVLIQSSQNSINHELALLAFVGQSFSTIKVYLGAGPVLMQTKTALYRAVGFGDVNGQPTDITGAPVNFASSQWVWGGAAQIGMMYTFTPTWFLDLNYTYAMTDKYKNHFSAPFTSVSNGLTYSGLAFITTSQRVTTQAFAVTVNKAF